MAWLRHTQGGVAEEPKRLRPAANAAFGIGGVVVAVVKDAAVGLDAAIEAAAGLQCPAEPPGGGGKGPGPLGFIIDQKLRGDLAPVALC